MTSGFLSQAALNRPAHKKTYCFMAGLPRAGSTMLSSILNQNPRIYSGPSSPVLSSMFVVESHFANDELYHGYPKPDQVKLILSNIINHFYDDVKKPVICDKNRAWVGRVEYINGYIGQDAKVIVPVRNIDEILTSMITMIRRNPYKEGNPRVNFIDEQLIKSDIPLNDDNRCEYIGGPGGILGQSMDAIRQGLNAGWGRHFHFVEYRDLVSNPQEEMNKIYKFIGEEPFTHNFNTLKNQNRESDMGTYGLRDMHEVRPVVKSTSKDPKEVLSERILSMCEGMEFWRPENYTQGVQRLPVNVVGPSPKISIPDPHKSAGFTIKQ